MNREKQLRNRTRHDFLLTFFNKEDTYSEKEINGFILIKQYNSQQQAWEVAIYTQDSYKKKKEFLMKSHSAKTTTQNPLL